MRSTRSVCFAGILLASVIVSLPFCEFSQGSALDNELSLVFGGDDPCYVDTTSPCPMNTQECWHTPCSEVGIPACPSGTEALLQIQPQFDNVAETPEDPGNTGVNDQTQINCTRRTQCSGCVVKFTSWRCKDGAQTQEDSRTPKRVDQASATCNDPTS